MSTQPFGADKYDLAADTIDLITELLDKVTTWRSNNRRVADYRIEMLYNGLAQARMSVFQLGAEEADLARERANAEPMHCASHHKVIGQCPWCVDGKCAQCGSDIELDTTTGRMVTTFVGYDHHLDGSPHWSNPK